MSNKTNEPQRMIMVRTDAYPKKPAEADDYQLPPYIYYWEDGEEKQDIPISQDTDEYIAYLNGNGSTPDIFDYLMPDEQADILLYHFLQRRNELIGNEYGEDAIHPVCEISWEPFWIWHHQGGRAVMDGPGEFYISNWDCCAEEDDKCTPHDVGVHTGAQAREFLKLHPRGILYEDADRKDHTAGYFDSGKYGSAYEPFYGKHIEGLGDMAKYNEPCFCMDPACGGYSEPEEGWFDAGPNGETPREWSVLGNSYDGVPEDWVMFLDERKYLGLGPMKENENWPKELKEASLKDQQSIREKYGTQKLTGTQEL